MLTPTSFLSLFQDDTSIQTIDGKAFASSSFLELFDVSLPTNWEVDLPSSLSDTVPVRWSALGS